MTHPRRKSWCAYLASLLSGALLAGSWTAATLAAELPPNPVGKSQANPTPAQIEQWIGDLDSDLFDTREHAQEALYTAGLAVLDPVAKVANEGSLESSTSALNILLDWSEKAKDTDLRIAALKKVQKLSGRPKESLLAGALLDNAKEEAALTKVIALGGRCAIDTQSRTPPIRLAGGVVHPLQITIDKHWRGGLDGLRDLKDLRRMVTLSFHSADFGAEILPVLKSLKQLRRIELYGMAIDKTMAEKWDLEIDYARIDHRGGAKLGIRGNQGAGARVMEVVPGTAAAKAGLKPRDLITHIDGTAVANFEELTRFIGNSCRAGQKVELIVKRQEVRGQLPADKRIEVTFDRWGFDQDTKDLDPREVMTPVRINFDRR